VSNFKEFLNVYEFDCTLPGSGKKIKFKPITTGQLKELLIYEDETDPMVIEEALDKLISSSVVTKDFDIRDLYLQDRFFLLLEIRKATKGEKYEFTQSCNKCGSQTLHSIDLNKLKTIKLKRKINSKIKINDNISIDLSIIKRKNQLEASEIIKSFDDISDSQRLTEMALLIHASTIESVTTPNGVEALDILDKKYILENIPTSIYEEIKEWHNKHDFGIEFTFNFECSKKDCENKEDVNIPLDNFFV